MRIRNKKTPNITIAKGLLTVGIVLMTGVGLGAAQIFAPANTMPAARAAAPSTQVTAAKDTADCNQAKLTKSNCQILEYLIVLINVLSTGVGIVVVGSIIYGGVQYTTAADDPQKISAAKGRIYNSIFALIAFIFGFAFLQWVVPGGVLN